SQNIKEDCREKDVSSFNARVFRYLFSTRDCFRTKRKGKCAARKRSHLGKDLIGNGHHDLRTGGQADFRQVRNGGWQAPTVRIYDERQSVFGGHCRSSDRTYRQNRGHHRRRRSGICKATSASNGQGEIFTSRGGRNCSQGEQRISSRQRHASAEGWATHGRRHSGKGARVQDGLREVELSRARPAAAQIEWK